MAAAVSVPYNFVASSPAIADNVDANFDSLVSWINTNAVHLDAAKAFTAIPSGPASDPSTANQLTRKSYVDALAVPTKVGVRRAAAQSIPSGAGADIQWDTEDFDASGFIAVTSNLLTVPASQAGTYAISARMTAAVPHVATVVLQNSSGSQVYKIESASASFPDTVVSATVYLAVADTVKITWAQSTGSGKNVVGRLVAVRLSA